MAALFHFKDRKRLSLFLLIGIILLGGMGLVWFQFFSQVPSLLLQTPFPSKQPKIDLSVFENPAFLELGEPRPPIPLLKEDEVGKRNLFVPTL